MRIQGRLRTGSHALHRAGVDRGDEMSFRDIAVGDRIASDHALKRSCGNASLGGCGGLAVKRVLETAIRGEEGCHVKHSTWEAKGETSGSRMRLHEPDGKKRPHPTNQMRPLWARVSSPSSHWTMVLSSANFAHCSSSVSCADRSSRNRTAATGTGSSGTISAS